MRRYSVSPATRAATVVLIAFFLVMAIGATLFVVLSSDPLKEIRGLIFPIFALAERGLRKFGQCAKW